MTEERARLPEKSEGWDTLRERLIALGSDDVDWRSKRSAVYVFHPGEDVLQVAKDAYALYQSENALGPAAFPSLRRMENEVIEMAVGLLNGPIDATGNMTSGGTESILLAVKSCRDAATARGHDAHGANIVLPRTAHLAFDKAAHYLGLEIRRVGVDADFLGDTNALRDAIDDRTIMLVGSAPCFPYGLVDPIPALAQIARDHDLWLHVDACVGGYLNPFAELEGVRLPPWDFRVEGVCSISADLHKYGYAAKGASTILHRSPEQHVHQVFQADDWPAGNMTTPTVAGTRPGGTIASAWAVMNHLGVEGYRDKTRRILAAREQITAGLEKLGLRVFGDPQLSLFSYGPAEDDPLSIFAVWKGMHDRGWFSGVVQAPDGIHLMLSPSHDEVADAYLSDLAQVVNDARAGRDEVDRRPAPVDYA
ncbi:MAG: aspartate aminotransferase family protein [Deltaproteobacteria bacterium]|nr:aspartate aminotransferase family protein [Deltaproteobacteria bacterium]